MSVGESGNLPRLARLASRGQGATLCIAGVIHGAYSETFIENHVRRIPMPKVLLFGRGLPFFDEQGRRLSLPRYHWSRVQQKCGRALGWDAAVTEYHNRCVEAFLKARRIGVVLAEYGQVGTALVDATRRAQVPLIVHFHGHDAYARDMLQTHGDDYRRMFDAAATIVAVSNDMQRQLISLGAPEEKIERIVYGVDVAQFPQATPGRNAPLFVAVGRFVEKKAPYLTILAFQKALDEVPGARLTMVGQGPLLEPCRQMATSLGLGDRVQFLGVQPPDRVANLMQQARAFVQHSQRASDGDSEGTPNAVLEAQASGLPVVATRHAGIKDVVIEGETGLLVDEGDINAMARHMVRLANAPNLAAQLGENARCRTVNYFTHEISTGRLTEVIRRASNHRAPLPKNAA